MSNFKLHTLDSAPEKGKELLQKSFDAYAMIPGLHAVMAESPNLLEAYQVVHNLFANASFDKNELTVVWQTINVENECHYCVPAHTGIAKGMGVDDKIIEALRNETPLEDEKLEALRDFTLSIVRDRGNVSDEKVKSFLEAGYTNQNILDIILGYSQKIMSNYTNHLAKTPVDSAFKNFEWSRNKK